jgi:TolB protein
MAASSLCSRQGSRARPFAMALLIAALAALAMTAGLLRPAEAQQPTFSVRGQGTALIRLNLALEPGPGVERPALLEAARATQRALLSSGFFAVGVLPPGQSGDSAAAGGWQSGQVAFPVTLSVERSGADEHRVQVSVADGGIGRTAFRREFQIVGGTMRDIGYATADIVYERFLGRQGYFTNRILYVREAMDRGRRVFQIVSSDLFGEGLQVHVSSRTELGSPRLAPNRSALYYVAITGERPQINRKLFATGADAPLFNDRGIRFSLDIDSAGNLYYTKSVDGNSDIYRLAPGSQREERLTTAPGIETEPRISPDGRQLAYLSDSSGRQQVLVQSLGGGDRRTAGTLPGRYGSPGWAPDSRRIALTRQAGGQFGLTVQNLDSGEEQQVSSSFFEERPVFASNGKVLLFERAARNRGADTGLWTVDVETLHVYRLPIEGLPRDATWIR